jgi:hypothetical protein
MKVLPITPEDWSALLAKQGGPELFQRPEWEAVHGASLKRFAVVDDSGAPVAGFQLIRSKRMGLSLWSQPSYAQHNGFTWEARARNSAKRIGEGKRIHAAIAAFLRSLPGVVHMGFPTGVEDMQPYIWAGFKVVPFYTYRIDLRPGLEAVQQDYAPELRNTIKKAAAEGVSVERTKDRDAVTKLIGATFERKEKHLDRSKVGSILQQFLAEERGFAFIAQRDGRPIAAAFCAVDAKRAYYLLGGHVKDGGHPGAGAMAVDACIREALRLGLSEFDMEGSMLPEVERYFRSFGGRLCPYMTVNRAPLALEWVLKARQRHLF